MISPVHHGFHCDVSSRQVRFVVGVEVEPRLSRGPMRRGKDTVLA